MAASSEKVKNIWMLSREYGDLAGAGGVKDVVCQLAESLSRWTGRTVNVVMPLYGFIDLESLLCESVADPVCGDRPLELSIPMHEPDRRFFERARFWCKRQNKVNIYFVDSLRFKSKSAVYTYTDADEQKEPWQKKSMGHHDYFAMNLLLQKAALELIIAIGEKPDVIHCHDGHTAILPALVRECPGYLSYFRTTGCLVTIHNAGLGYHQEVADIPYAHSICGLPLEVILGNRLNKKFDPFLVAGQYAILNTVSENYARELQLTNADSLTGWLGHELLARNVVLEGVTNGISPQYFPIQEIAGDFEEYLFDPADEADDLQGKRRFKKNFVGEIVRMNIPRQVISYGSLQSEDVPLFTFIGRLSEQKGVDILLDVLSGFLARHPKPQVLILGDGDTELEEKVIRLTGKDEIRGRLCFLKGFHPQFAARVYAAGDFFIIPSRFEPCGLTDFIAQLYANIPIVHHVGGLVKVVDGETGIGYSGDQHEALSAALERALILWDRPEEMRRIQLQAVEIINEKYTWNKVMKRYLDLYRRARQEQFRVIAGENV